MRIAIDADHLFRYPLRGIQKTTVSLYKTLGKLRPSWSFSAYHQFPGECPPLAGINALKSRRIDIKGDRFRRYFNPWERIRLPIAALGHDLLHVPSNAGASWAPCPIVLTLHDLTPLEYPTPDTQRWWKGVVRSARGARAIVTCSRHVADRIRKELPEVKDRLRVIYWGRDHEPEDAASGVALKASSDARRLHGLDDRPYYLAFGTAHPRKNIARLLKAWDGLALNLRSGNQLVVVGLRLEDLKRLSGTDLHESVRGLTDVSESHLEALIRSASAVCYLSLSEGFGLPVLEAFCCGTPVIASNSSSIPEVAGDAALLVNPDSIDEIKGGLSKLMSSPSLRADLREAGLVRAAMFDWRNCAEEYAEVFETCI